MASPQAADKWLCNNKTDVFWCDDDFSSAAEADAAWLDMRGYAGIVAILTAGNLTGAGVKALSFYADSDADGNSGDAAAIVNWSGDVGSAEGDYLVLEMTAEQLAQEAADVGVDYRYVIPYITLDNAADEGVVTVIRYGPQFAYDGLTADSVT